VLIHLCLQRKLPLLEGCLAEFLINKTNEITVLSDIKLTVIDGEIVELVASSGAGCTILIIRF
jgi:ABC-type nitrate/sulfonate/bicarbonate transport system ATPase subunit